MTAGSFDFASLLPAGLPAPAVKWTGAPRYNFTGGNNDADQLPLDGLIAAAEAVLRREGRTLASYGLTSGPQGYRPLREFLARKLKQDAGISCTFDDVLIVSGSLQALDLINGVLLTRGDTVVIEQETYQGALTRLNRLGVNAVGIPLDQDGMRWRRRSPISSAATSGRNTSTRSRPCRIRPARSCRSIAESSFSGCRKATACRSSRMIATPTSFGTDGGRPRSTP